MYSTAQKMKFSIIKFFIFFNVFYPGAFVWENQLFQKIRKI